MAEVALSKVEPGEVVGRDIILPDGTLVVRSGTVLSKRDLRSLKSRGIETVFVGEGASTTEQEFVSEEEYYQRHQRLNRMFKNVEAQPHMLSIKEAACRQLRRFRPWEQR